MKKFVGKEKLDSVPFMDGEVKVRMLTVGQAKEIEAKRKELMNVKKGEEVDNLELLRFVIRLCVVDAQDMSEEDFESLPIMELTKLTEKIMSLSGVDEGNE